MLCSPFPCAVVLKWGQPCPPRQRLETFLIITAGVCVGATGIKWMETRDAGKPLTWHGTAPQRPQTNINMWRLPWLTPAQAGSLPDPAVQEVLFILWLHSLLPSLQGTSLNMQPWRLCQGHRVGTCLPCWAVCSVSGPAHFCAHPVHRSSWPLPCHHQGYHQLPQLCSACPLGPPHGAGDPPNPQRACWLQLGEPAPTPVPSSRSGAHLAACPSPPHPLHWPLCPGLLGCLPSPWVPGQEDKSVSIQKGKCVCLGSRGVVQGQEVGNQTMAARPGEGGPQGPNQLRSPGSASESWGWGTSGPGTNDQPPTSKLRQR